MTVPLIVFHPELSVVPSRLIRVLKINLNVESTGQGIIAEPSLLILTAAT